MYKVMIRADGGPRVGMGHIMRCIALGKMFVKKGHEVGFVSRYAEGQEVIRENGLAVMGFGGRQEDLVEIVKGDQPDILVVDHYEVNQGYFLSLKPHVKLLVYIDDLNGFSYPVDVVINGNITGEEMNYLPYDKEQEFLLGNSYTLMREEFQNLPKRKPKQEVEKILITTGGSDPFGMTEKWMEGIRREVGFDPIKLHVIIGNSFKNIASIREIQKRYKNIILHQNVKQISHIMLDCDVALSSCGSTLYELCACGVPTLGWILAENQRRVAEKMDEQGYIQNMGGYDQWNQGQMIGVLKGWIGDLTRRQHMIVKQQNLVDGRGTKRVVSFLSKRMEEWV